MRTPRIMAVALLTAIGILAFVTPTRADTAAPGPSLIDTSAPTQTPIVFTVTGKGFTPEGRVYLAIYDQMGTQLYETRWIIASPASTSMVHQLGDGPLGRTLVATPGGALEESFAQLCGARAMMRGLDESTASWSNWLTVQPPCLS